MFSSWLEAALITLILAGMAFAVFRGGAANPVSTGGLNRRLDTLDHDMSHLKTNVGRFETRIAEFEQRAATKGDIDRIEARFEEWDRKFALIDRLDDRLDAVDRDLAKMQSLASSSHTVVEATAESLRVTNLTMQGIERKTEANAAITHQVPGFIEKILERVAETSARVDGVCKQVDMVYQVITERGMK